MTLPRLDLLIYAHDGRGLGHASRCIAVGMAVRRLFPEMKVLFVSGARASSDLIYPAALDWIKLPSYETAVIKGKSYGQPGRSNFSDKDLGVLRAEMIKSIVSLYKPRCVLVDHMPQGKHKELRPALEAAGLEKPVWVLGIRGVIGSVKQVWSELALSLFKAHYHTLLWYGDTNLLGHSHVEGLQEQFGVQPLEAGYVSRLSEHLCWDATLQHRDPALAGTMSVPWTGEASISLLGHLAEAVEKIGDKHGQWRIFVDLGQSTNHRDQISKMFRDLTFCQVEQTGSAYVRSLLNSKVSVIYGGYNSLTDVLCAKIPSVVILRDMQDKEQEAHASRITGHVGTGLVFMEENKADTQMLYGALQKVLSAPPGKNRSVKLNGAETAARVIAGLVKKT